MFRSVTDLSRFTLRDALRYDRPLLSERRFGAGGCDSLGVTSNESILYITALLRARRAKLL
jgi:hypothetical protein